MQQCNPAAAAATEQQITVHFFVSGKLYSVSQVKALFGRSDQWIRDKIRAKKLSGTKLGGVGPFMISGESVRALYGSLKLAADVAAAQAVPAVPLQKAVDREFRRQRERNAKGKAT